MSNTEKYLGITIDYNKDKSIPEQGIAYLTGDGFYKKENEYSPQHTYARASTSYCFGDYEFAQRIYNYVSDGWFMFASPVISNAQEINWPKSKDFHKSAKWLKQNVVASGLPISCFLGYIPDTKEGLVEARKEASWLSMMGGGVGMYASNRSPDRLSTGVMSHLRGYDADTLSYRQTSTRRGSMAAYLDIDHPEIMQFIQMRNPVGGDQNQKCFNLNNAVNITDEFMNAVVNGEKYELIDPKHGRTGNFLEAREVWEEILKLRYETGEPYMNFIDTVNRGIPEWITKPTYKVVQSNLCVAPETLILTDKGYETISELEGEKVNVWNGEEWSEVEVVKTGTNQELVTVKTSSGFEMDCTEYHKFYVIEGNSRDGRVVEKRATDLRPGDKLIKLETPIIVGQKVLQKAYENGFYSGDGCTVNGKARIYLYGEKRKLAGLFEDKLNNYVQEGQDREYFYIDGLQYKYFVPDASYDVESRVQWFAGLLDSDGCLLANGKSQTLQVASTQEGFLESVQLMLQTLGIQSKVTHGRDAGNFLLPANDGTNSLKEFACKKTVRLLINGMGIVKLLTLGMKTYRLKPTNHVPNRDASGFVKVQEVIRTGRIDDTYCFTEPKRHMGVFNGLLTGQCSEIALMTSPKRTAVCCLSSVNVEKFDEWRDDPLFIADLIRLLDNVLEYFIQLAPEQLWRAIRSAQKERAVGLGAFGWASWFQKNMIPFESGFLGANGQCDEITSLLKRKAVVASQQLALERGEPDDVAGSGMRNSHLLAFAPNASSASILGASPATEPWAGNAFTAQGRAGSFLIKNKYLKKLLKEKGFDTDEIWSSIILNEGSVQHLDCLTDEEKRVFVTSYEVSPMWIVEHAATRQKYVCQSQSVNIFVGKGVTLQELSDIHMKAWKQGLKSLYYCRAKPATKAQVGTGGDKPLNAVPVKTKIEYEECLACQG